MVICTLVNEKVIAVGDSVGLVHILEINEPQIGTK